MKWLLRVYPPAWRQRYQEEMLALLEEHQITWRTRVDLLLSALDAWMNPQVMGPKRLSTAEQALYLRRAHRTIFWAFPMFIAGFMLALDGVDDAFQAWNRAHIPVSIWKSVTAAVMAVGFVAFLTTGSLLACVLIHKAARQRPNRLRWLASGGMVLLLGLCVLRVPVPIPAPYGLPFLVTAFPLAIAAGLSRYEVSPKLLRYALAPIGCTVAAMAAHALFFAGWACLVWNVSAQTVPQLAQAEDCPLLSGGSRHLRLLVGILWMAWMTGCAIWSFVRALGALTRAEVPAL